MFYSKYLKRCHWWLPFLCYSLDANAWGLVTHVYFSHSLLWAMPLLDSRLRNVIQKFPELVMAGACIPDLAIVSHHFSHTHGWEHAHKLLMAAETDVETAIAIGYMSHLYIDVIAHNHFVPAHEAMWHKNQVLTHIASEWAMDAHLAPLIKVSPRYLMNKHKLAIVKFISAQFDCPEPMACSALTRLAFWDGVLRFVRLPELIYKVVRLLDNNALNKFIYYIAKTQIAIANIGEVLSGGVPELEPELKNLSVEQLDVWREECLMHLKMLHPSPIQYFTKSA